MHAYGVHVFHTANGNGAVVAVAHNLKLYFLISLYALFHKHLMHGRELKRVHSNLNQLVFVVCKAAARAAESKRRAQNHGITDFGSRLFCLLEAVGYLGRNNGLAYRLAHLLKQLPVLCALDALAACAEQLHSALLEHALLFKLHSEIKSRLSAYAGNDGVGTLVAEYLCDILERKRLHINLVGDRGIRHNSRGVGVYENDLIALLL